MDFSLSFSHGDVKLNGDETTYSINQRLISAAFFYINNPFLKTGLNIGSSYISMDDDAATAGLDLNGNHIGFCVKGTLGKNPRLGMLAQYLYQEAKGSNSLRSATLSWFEWHIETSLILDIGTYWTLNAGAGVAGIDARRRVSGDINNTLKLNQETAFQGRAGVDLNTHPDGKISFIVSRGINNGVQLAFSREF